MTLRTKLLNEMATVGQLNGQRYIMVHSRDGGQIPHFHILDTATNGQKFNCAIKIRETKYFIHSTSKNTLNLSEGKELVEFLQSKNATSKRFKDFTNWEVLLSLWNMNDSPINVDENMPLRAYENLVIY